MGEEVLFYQGKRILAGALVGAVLFTTVPVDVFRATEKSEVIWEAAAGFSAGAHHAIEECVVIDEAVEEYMVSAILKGDIPVVSVAEEAVRKAAEEEAARIAAEKAAAEEAARKAAEEKARLAAEKLEKLQKEEAARLEAERNKKREEEKKQAAKKKAQQKKQYVAPKGGTGHDVADYAVQFVGNPYVLGGSSLTNGIDCSNFVMRIYEAFGVSLPHNSYKLRSVGYEVSASEIKPGDIICYEGHVSIYIGNGKCVHAANKDDGIKISPKWNYTKVITIRRIF